MLQMIKLNRDTYAQKPGFSNGWNYSLLALVILPFSLYVLSMFMLFEHGEHPAVPVAVGASAFGFAFLLPRTYAMQSRLMRIFNDGEVELILSACFMGLIAAAYTVFAAPSAIEVTAALIISAFNPMIHALVTIYEARRFRATSDEPVKYERYYHR